MSDLSQLINEADQQSRKNLSEILRRVYVLEEMNQRLKALLLSADDGAWEQVAFDNVEIGDCIKSCENINATTFILWSGVVATLGGNSEPHRDALGVVIARPFDTIMRKRS